MKTIKLNKLAILLLSFVVFTACVEDDDFNTPDLSITDPTIPGDIVEIEAVKGSYLSSGDEIFTFENTNDYMVGYVVSSDESGNFFKQLVLQDKAVNPTSGIRIQIDVNPLFTTFDFGRKVYIKLDGLSIGIRNGMIQLGRRDGNEVGRISAANFSEFLIRTPEVATIEPLEVSISDFSDALENIYIRLNDVQFNRAEIFPQPRTYAADASDDFDGERVLESCADGGTVILSTSTFADFKTLNLSSGRGYVDVVLQRDFFDDFYTVYLNSPEGVVFDNDVERCDPNVLECTGSFGGGTVLFSENFTAYTNIGQAEAAGWTNINTTGGSLEYVLATFSGNKYAQISGFGSGQANIDTWLVTPEINLDGTTGESLTFDLEVAFANGVILSALITDDYTGDVLTTEWTQLDINIPNVPTSGFGGFNNVGNINISCLDGNVRVAFRYQGSDPSATTRYHVDNVTVRGN
jgi:hypothetical protein